MSANQRCPPWIYRAGYPWPGTSTTNRSRPRQWPAHHFKSQSKTPGAGVCAPSTVPLHDHLPPGSKSFKTVRPSNAPDGQAITSGLGDIRVEIRAEVFVGGQQINSAIGDVETNADSIVSLAGVEANFAIGTLFIWSQIDTDQTPNYNLIDDSQSPGWSDIDNSQSAGYVDISTSQSPSYSTIDRSQTPDWTELEAGRDAA